MTHIPKIDKTQHAIERWCGTVNENALDNVCEVEHRHVHHAEADCNTHTHSRMHTAHSPRPTDAQGDQEHQVDDEFTQRRLDHPLTIDLIVVSQTRLPYYCNCFG
jgi:hypothetical protein